MRIDLKVVRTVGNDLKKCRIKIDTLHESMKKIHTGILAQDCDAFDEEMAELHKKLSDLEDEIAQMNSLIVGLNGMVSVYEKTEKKNIAKLNSITYVSKGATKDVVISVPDNITGLFR